MKITQMENLAAILNWQNKEAAHNASCQFNDGRASIFHKKQNLSGEVCGRALRHKSKLLITFETFARSAELEWNVKYCQLQW